MNWNTFRLILAIILIASVPSESYSEEMLYIDYRDSIGLIHNLQIKVQDNVSGNCWTNASAVENRVTAKLEQAGIRTYSESLAFFNGVSGLLYLDGSGFRTNTGLCVGSFSYSVSAQSSLIFGSEELTGKTWSARTIPRLYENGSVGVGPKHLNENILKQADSFTDELIDLIHKGRRALGVIDLLSNMPHLTQEPMTQEMFRELFDSSLNNEN